MKDTWRNAREGVRKSGGYFFGNEYMVKILGKGPARNINYLACMFFVYPMIITDYLSTPFVRTGTLLFMPMIFVYSLYKVGIKGFMSNTQLKLFLLLIVMMSMSYFVATDIESYLFEMKRMLGVFCFISGITILSDLNIKYLYFFYFLYIVKFFSILLLSYVSGFNLSYSPLERLEVEGLNANVYGYFSFFGIVSLALVRKGFKSNLFRNCMFASLGLLLIILAYLFIFIAANRAGFIVLNLFVIFTPILYIYLNNRHRFRSVWYIVIFIALVICVGTVFNTKFISGSLIEKRFVDSFSTGYGWVEDIRVDTILKAVEYGLENPILGLGSGHFGFISQTKEFSHCSYAELFANNGIIALFLYLIFYWLFAKELIFAFKFNTIDVYSVSIFSAFVVLYFIYEFFYVFYLDQYMCGFFFLVLAHLKALNRGEWFIRSNKINVSRRPVESMEKRLWCGVR